ncbi:MAG: ChaN family lipoprotein, partial [Allosphingosinicella sp.]
MRVASLAALLFLAAPAAACPPPGQWIDEAGQPVPERRALARLAEAPVILLGERHGTPAHHRWQAEVVAALARRGPVVIGLEQLPPEAQPALDRLVAGAINLGAFRAESRWDELWGHDLEAYRPLFEVARARAIPMVALNIDRAFVRRVGRAGYAAAAADGAAPVGRPAPAPAAYAETLAASFRQHALAAGPEALARFIEAQTVWDRAMAEAIVRARIANPRARFVAITGWGH